MDMSVVLEEERPVSVTEVPDYQEDVHTYLREMEVTARRAPFCPVCSVGEMALGASVSVLTARAVPQCCTWAVEQSSCIHTMLSGSLHR